MRVALDSNVLIYAELEPESRKGQRAKAVILRAMADAVIPAQVLGEFVRFVQRRAPYSLEAALGQVTLYRTLCLAPPTTDALIVRAAATSRDHGLQLWDAIICHAAAEAGAKALLTEDLQDGRVIAGLKILNPFEDANDAAIDAMLDG
jgi:predicted nucleic acid-binding protein